MKYDQHSVLGSFWLPLAQYITNIANRDDDNVKSHTDNEFTTITFGVFLKYDNHYFFFNTKLSITPESHILSWLIFRFSS